MMKATKITASQFCFDVAAQLSSAAFDSLMRNPCQQLYVVGRRDGLIWRDMRVAQEPSEGELTVISSPFSPAHTVEQMRSELHRYLRSEPILPPELFA